MKKISIAALVAAATLASVNSYAELKVSTDGGLRVTTDEYQFRVGGRIMYDFNRAEANGVVDENGMDLRRGRIFFSGQVADDWSFKSQYEFSDNTVKDMYIRYSGWGSAAVLTVGNQKLPFGLEELESSKDISLIERSAITEFFAERRAESVSLSGKFDSNQTYSVAVFSSDAADAKDEDIGFAARYSLAPIKTSDQVVHLGVAYRDVADISVTGLELAGALGSLHAEAEYADGDFGALSESGYYVKVGYILTGETRPYSGGVFGRVTPETAGGAWELVARYENGYGDHGDIELGETDATSYALGVNWYPHKNIRVGASYTDGESNLNNDEGNEFRVRLQVTF